MRKSLFLIASFLLVSCAKEEFAANKGTQTSAISAAQSFSHQTCASSTLVSPQVDVLVLWDNSSSALFINSSTKASYSQLITSISDNFDYHILSAPLISTNSSNILNEASLVVKDSTSVSGSAAGILKSKDQAAAAIGFTQASGSSEPGLDRVASLIDNNRSNGIFRNGAYTIIVVMSNGDDTSCDIANNHVCTTNEGINYIKPKINKLLCLRGNTSGIDCSGVSSLNSSMMRFINISALTSCTNGLGLINTRYREAAKTIYNTGYINGWPVPTDNLSPFTSGGIAYPDSYNICSISFSNIFDGVNTAIKQTLIKHVYDYWPVAGTNDSVDPDTIRVTRVGADNSNTNLVNNTNTGVSSSGFKYIGVQNNHSTRVLPTTGEPFTGKMIQLFAPSTGAHDQVIYPECLKVTYSEVKSNYGYIYLTNGEPSLSTLEVYINGVAVPQSSSNGWDYMGWQSVTSLDTADYKIVKFPYDQPVSAGYFIRLNGTAKFSNSSGNTINVYYTSKTN